MSRRQSVVKALTTAALDEEWHGRSSGPFWPGPNPNASIPDDQTPLVKSFLGHLRECAADYLRGSSAGGTARDPHYEDLFSLAEQAARAFTDHSPNLAVVEFQRRLKNSSAAIWRNFGSGSENDRFTALAKEACEFLHWVVHHRLTTAVKVRQGLDGISETANAVDSLDIFTLNHDLLVEKQLKADGIEYEDGFNDEDRGEFFVYSDWRSGIKVHLLKLHGSLNWYLYKFEN